MAEAASIEVFFDNLQDLYESLKRVAALIRGRKDDGWTLFRSDETWVYHTATYETDLTCDVCLKFARNDYDGERVRTDFPAREVTDPIEVRPNVHEDPQYYWLRGRCRCTLKFDKHVETLTTRLADEMRRVA